MADKDLEEFWKVARPVRLPPAPPEPPKESYADLLELIPNSVKLREQILDKYLETPEGRRKLFASVIHPARTVIRDQRALALERRKFNLQILTRVLLHADGTEGIDRAIAEELILGLRELERGIEQTIAEETSEPPPVIPRIPVYDE